MRVRLWREVLNLALLACEDSPAVADLVPLPEQYFKFWAFLRHLASVQSGQLICIGQLVLDHLKLHIALLDSGEPSCSGCRAEAYHVTETCVQSVVAECLQQSA